MLRKLKKAIQNRRGSILLEALTGTIILGIVIFTFTEMVTQANILVAKADVITQEWERIYAKMERQEYSANFVDGSEFPVTIRLNNIKKSDIILSNGMPAGSDAAVITGGSQINILNGLYFRKYTEPVRNYAATDGNAYVYGINIR